MNLTHRVYYIILRYNACVYCTNNSRYNLNSQIGVNNIARENRKMSVQQSYSRGGNSSEFECGKCLQVIS